MARLQKTLSREQLARANYRDSVAVLGYWRSGTTLQHHAAAGVALPRFPDEMEVRPGSRQEDEFALLSLGARSPYEALLIAAILPEALTFTDSRDLTPQDEKRWREVFLSFLAGISARGVGRSMILKSPTHGFRVSTLRELLPDARFILIVRDELRIGGPDVAQDV
jgi:hypothetical protein